MEGSLAKSYFIGFVTWWIFREPIQSAIDFNWNVGYNLKEFSDFFLERRIIQRRIKGYLDYMCSSMKKIKIVGYSLLVAGMIFLAISLLIDKFIVGIAGMLVASIGMIYFCIKWHCPYCKISLPLYGMLGMTYCPYCGNELDS